MFFNKQRRIDRLERAQVLDAVMGLQQVLNEADVINELLLVAQRVATRMERGEDARRWANRLVVSTALSPCRMALHLMWRNYVKLVNWLV